MISVGELLFEDYTNIGQVHVDKNRIWNNIDIFLPIVSSDKANQNQSFKESFEAHKEFYKQLRTISIEAYDSLDANHYIDICDDGYSDAIKDDRSKVEASVNYVAILFFIWFSMKTVPLISCQPAAFKQIAAKDVKVKRNFENTDPSLKIEANVILSEIEDDIENEIWDLLTTIKKSAEWAELADYYVALKYVWNLINNDLSWGFNQRIGVEMMISLVCLKNKYAIRFLRFSKESIKE